MVDFHSWRQGSILTIKLFFGGYWAVEAQLMRHGSGVHSFSEMPCGPKSNVDCWSSSYGLTWAFRAIWFLG